MTLIPCIFVLTNIVLHFKNYFFIQCYHQYILNIINFSETSLITDQLLQSETLEKTITLLLLIIAICIYGSLQIYTIRSFLQYAVCISLVLKNIRAPNL